MPRIKLEVDVPEGEYCHTCEHMDDEGEGFCFVFRDDMDFDDEGFLKCPKCLKACKKVEPQSMRKYLELTTKQKMEIFNKDEKQACKEAEESTK